MELRQIYSGFKRKSNQVLASNNVSIGPQAVDRKTSFKLRIKKQNIPSKDFK